MNDFEGKRKDYISWDKYFMEIAILSSKRSKDPSTQVGACIVGQDNRILSVGYNGTPNGFDDENFNWNREGDFINSKYAYVVHAEPNAILNFKGNSRDLENSKMYVTLFPCNECAKLIVQSGIKELIYLFDKYKDKDFTIVAKKIFDECGIKYKQFNE